MSSSDLDRAATAAAEEILRLIYGDDLEGCAVSLDSVAGVIRGALEQQASHSRDVAELHAKGFEAVQLLSKPPADGALLTPEDLRSLLGERLDKIQSLSSQIIAATAAPRAIEINSNDADE